MASFQSSNDTTKDSRVLMVILLLCNSSIRYQRQRSPRSSVVNPNEMIKSIIPYLHGQSRRIEHGSNATFAGAMESFRFTIGSRILRTSGFNEITELVEK